jgi:ankyrin repeat protein
MVCLDRLLTVFSGRYISFLFVSMLTCGASLAQADDTDDFILAVKFDDIKAVQTLLKKGMNVNASEPIRGETVMMISLRENSAQVFDALLHSPNIQLDARANNGDTALMLASYFSNLPAVTKLIAFGAKVNQSGWTALHYAASVGDTQIMLMLLEKAAHIDAKSPNKTTPLMMAVRSGSTSAVQLLIDKGADCNLINELGLSALDFAIQLEKREIAALLSTRLNQNSKPQ